MRLLNEIEGKISSTRNPEILGNNHIIYTYTDLNRYYENAMIYLAEGIDLQQTVFYIGWPKYFESIIKKLVEAGYSESQINEVIFLDVNEIYSEQEFNIEDANQKYHQLYKKYTKDDKVTRVWGVITWNFQHQDEFFERLLLHKKHWNTIFTENQNFLVVCVYDGTTLPASCLNDLLQCHGYHMTDNHLAPSHLYRKDPVQFPSISEQIQLEQEARDRDFRMERLAVASDMASTIAHEIRNPLAVIKGLLQLSEKVDDINKINEYHKAIDNQLVIIEKIATEFLNLAKPHSDHKRDTDISELIKDVDFLMKPLTDKKTINLHTNTTHNNIIIKCDEMKIKQVIINLVKNAMEEMDNGNIVIKVKNFTDEIRIYIIDDGPGMSDSTVNHIGKPFITTKEEGTGLGILISKNIIKNHNGTLIVNSKLGAGTKFTISLPK